MKTLYELRDGKIGRKNHEGMYERHRAPYRFVPAPNELKLDRYRLTAVGAVPDDSLEVKAAILNTNTVDYPDPLQAIQDAEVAFPDVASGKSNPEPVDVTLRSTELDTSDMTKLSVAQAISAIELSEDLAQLEAWAKQEAANKPKVRGTVMKAIVARKAALNGTLSVAEAID